MSVIVQKFGGTSVADSQKILAAARRAIRAQQEGHQVVVVVSAMGQHTDQLIGLTRQINDAPPAREMDMLLATGEQVSVALMAMAVDALGAKAISFTGAQMGIYTDSTHTKARISSIDTARMRKELADGRIVIAAGFQGIDRHGNITTLGRGGSDTTAVALAAELDAEVCEIYTDVDGVYTTDPRQLPEARRMDQVSYDEMLELASLGAGVMHSRSIEFGKKFHVPIHVRHSSSDAGGTMIVAEPEAPDLAVSGAALTKDEARVTVADVPDRPGTSLALFSRIAARHVAVDMIVQNVGADGRANISFTVVRGELPATLSAVEEATFELGAARVTHDENVAKVSVVGLGMASQTGVAKRMFRALADAGVNILMITTSEIKISVLVAREQALAALRAVHRAFELEKPHGLAVTAITRTAVSPRADDMEVERRLGGMEALTIDDVSLDDRQARVTISGVPDAPGVAAQVFEEVAAAQIFVDMIVQSYGAGGQADLSFTVPQPDVGKAQEVAERLARKFSCKGVTSATRVAKLSVSGIGMRSHTEVAIRMFRVLAKAGINVEMINTSEVRVNVVVDGAAGDKALLCLKAAFRDVME